MKRTIGIASIILVVIAYLYYATLLTSRDLQTAFDMFPMIVGATIIGYIGAIVCLGGDVIRYIGKMFASGYNNSTDYCPSCGRKIDRNSKFCNHCGEKIS